MKTMRTQPKMLSSKSRMLSVGLGSRGLVSADSAGFAEKIINKLQKRSGSEWRSFTLSYLTEEETPNAAYNGNKNASNSLALNVLFKLYCESANNGGVTHEIASKTLLQSIRSILIRHNTAQSKIAAAANTSKRQGREEALRLSNELSDKIHFSDARSGDSSDFQIRSNINKIIDRSIPGKDASIYSIPVKSRYSGLYHTERRDVREAGYSAEGSRGALTGINSDGSGKSPDTFTGKILSLLSRSGKELSQLRSLSANRVNRRGVISYGGGQTRYDQPYAPSMKPGSRTDNETAKAIAIRTGISDDGYGDGNPNTVGKDIYENNDHKVDSPDNNLSLDMRRARNSGGISSLGVSLYSYGITGRTPAERMQEQGRVQELYFARQGSELSDGYESGVEAPSASESRRLSSVRLPDTFAARISGLLAKTLSGALYYLPSKGAAGPPDSAAEQRQRASQRLEDKKQSEFRQPANATELEEAFAYRDNRAAGTNYEGNSAATYKAGRSGRIKNIVSLPEDKNSARNLNAADKIRERMSELYFNEQNGTAGDYNYEIAAPAVSGVGRTSAVFASRIDSLLSRVMMGGSSSHGYSAPQTYSRQRINGYSQLFNDSVNKLHSGYFNNFASRGYASNIRTAGTEVLPEDERNAVEAPHYIYGGYGNSAAKKKYSASEERTRSRGGMPELYYSDPSVGAADIAEASAPGGASVSRTARHTGLDAFSAKIGRLITSAAGGAIGLSCLAAGGAQGRFGANIHSTDAALHITPGVQSSYARPLAGSGRVGRAQTISSRGGMPELYYSDQSVGAADIAEASAPGRATASRTAPLTGLDAFSAKIGRLITSAAGGAIGLSNLAAAGAQGRLSANNAKRSPSSRLPKKEIQDNDSDNILNPNESSDSYNANNNRTGVDSAWADDYVNGSSRRERELKYNSPVMHSKDALKRIAPNVQSAYAQPSADSGRVGRAQNVSSRGGMPELYYSDQSVGAADSAETSVPGGATVSRTAPLTGLDAFSAKIGRLITSAAGGAIGLSSLAAGGAQGRFGANIHRIDAVLHITPGVQSSYARPLAGNGRVGHAQNGSSSGGMPELYYSDQSAAAADSTETSVPGRAMASRTAQPTGFDAFSEKIGRLITSAAGGAIGLSNLAAASAQGRLSANNAKRSPSSRPPEKEIQDNSSDNILSLNESADSFNANNHRTGAGSDRADDYVNGSSRRERGLKYNSPVMHGKDALTRIAPGIQSAYGLPSVDSVRIAGTQTGLTRGGIPELYYPELSGGAADSAEASAPGRASASRTAPLTGLDTFSAKIGRLISSAAGGSIGLSSLAAGRAQGRFSANIHGTNAALHIAPGVQNSYARPLAGSGRVSRTQGYMPELYFSGSEAESGQPSARGAVFKKAGAGYTDKALEAAINGISIRISDSIARSAKNGVGYNPALPGYSAKSGSAFKLKPDSGRDSLEYTGEKTVAESAGDKKYSRNIRSDYRPSSMHRNILFPSSAVITGRIREGGADSTARLPDSRIQTHERSAYPELVFQTEREDDIAQEGQIASGKQAAGAGRKASVLARLISSAADTVAKGVLPISGKYRLSKPTAEDGRRSKVEKLTDRIQKRSDMTILNNKEEEKQASVLDMLASPKSEMRNVFSPAEMVMYAPPSYMNQFGAAGSPIGRQDWKNVGWNDTGARSIESSGTAKVNWLRGSDAVSRDNKTGAGQQEANEFFKAQAILSEKVGGPFSKSEIGKMASLPVQRYQPPEMTYKESANAVTGKLLSQQVQKPRTINTPIKTTKEIQVSQNVNQISEAELNKMVDKVYYKLESRLKAEKRRFGL